MTPSATTPAADLARLVVRAGSHEYPIVIGSGSVERALPLVQELRPGARPFVITNPLVWRLHGAALTSGDASIAPLLMPDGERFKHLQTAARLYEGLIRGAADRHAVVIAFGGGVVGDTGGFVAATYLRGVALVQVPTTLLAQVDAAIGGKVGVNHALGKNLIGAFHPPLAVSIDPSLLATLPRREFRAGLYEVVKYGVIASRSLFERVTTTLNAIFARDAAALLPIITESCRIKADVVSADERETGLRRVLNFGHTAGHALEAITRYRRFRHGEAVAYGMEIAAEVAAGRAAIPDEDRAALRNLIVQMGPLPPLGDLSVSDALDAIRRDKKIIAGRLHFVLPTAIGTTAIVDDVTEEELAAAMRRVGMR